MTRSPSEKTEGNLFRAIEQDPDAVEPYLVYADWLLEHGDPQGELIVLQHRLPAETNSAEEES